MLIKPILASVLLCISLVSEVDSIVRGQDAVRNKWTFIASIRYLGQPFCAGSIIGKRWILTAGHCLKYRGIFLSRNHLLVVVGTYLRKRRPELPYAHAVRMVRQHRDYVPSRCNDIGIILTHTEIIEELGKVSIIALPDAEFNFQEGTRVETAGWGSLKEDGRKPRKLQELWGKIYNQMTCKAQYDFAGYDNVCMTAGLGRGICDGDSGGPMIVKSRSPESSRYLLVGLTAWSMDPCAWWADVFTRVDRHKQWIESTQEKMLCEERGECQTSKEDEIPGYDDYL